MATLTELLQADTQKRTLVVQVYRNSQWITVPVQTLSGNMGRHKAGQVTLTIPDDPSDTKRTQLYEGDKVRMYRGVEGAPPVRFWTGFVDSRTPRRSGPAGIVRTFVVTDHIKELNDAMMIDGAVYDNMRPAAAVADIIQRMINSGQLALKDDAGNALTSTASYTSSTGNPICYLPDVFNDDGTAYVLASGTLASYTGANPGQPYATFQIPVASGSSYSTFELPNRYLIGSTTTIVGFTQVASSQAFPPAPHTYILDSFNGLFYFNPADASTTASFSATYYNPPNFAYEQGRMAGAAITDILDKVGYSWSVDGNGKFIIKYMGDSISVPKRIFPNSAFIDNGVEINRDRRNVVACLGWDGNCGQIVAAKAVNYDDINNAPPLGLGKRAYVIIQDKSWSTQYAVNKAALYALKQIGRRGKLASATILDDPSLRIEDVLCFESPEPEISSGDFFVIDNLTFNLSVSSGQVNATATLGGSLAPGRGMFYLGPAVGATTNGSLDYSQDIRPITNAYLTPSGGTFYSNFSKAVGLTLSFTIGTLGGVEWIDLYGSDGSHIVAEAAVARSANQTLNLPIPMGSITAGVLYCLQLYFKDANGNIGVYRDFINARA